MTPFLQHLPEDEREPFAAAVREAARTTRPTLDDRFDDEQRIIDEGSTAVAILECVSWDFIYRAERGDSAAGAVLAVLDQPDNWGEARRYALSVMAEVRR